MSIFIYEYQSDRPDDAREMIDTFLAEKRAVLLIPRDGQGTVCAVPNNAAGAEVMKQLVQHAFEKGA